jgi:hypothetical protein
MPLIENKYRAAATTELEREIRRLEEKDAAFHSSDEHPIDVGAVTANVDFAERIRLLDAEQAHSYRERISKLRFEALLRTQTSVIVDDFENPIESSMRLQGLDEYNALISLKRALYAAYINAKSCDDERTL